MLDPLLRPMLKLLSTVSLKRDLRHSLRIDEFPSLSRLPSNRRVSFAIHFM